MSLTAFAFLAISSTVLMTSCQKNDVVNTQKKNSKRTPMQKINAGYLSAITGLDFHIGFGEKVSVFEDGILMGTSCLGYGYCEATSAQNGTGQTGVGVKFGDIDPNFMKLYMVNVDANFADNNPLIVRPNTDVPDEIRLHAGMPNAKILPGSYPMLFSPEAPNGYFEFDIMP